MADPQIEWPDLSTYLVHFPKHVHAIGMMVVEMTGMEVMLGDLFGALLDLNHHEGHQIYFTPKAAIPRVDVLTNVVSCNSFDKFPTIRNGTEALAKRAKALMGKRHAVIHAHWVVSNDGQMVGRIRPPFDYKKGPETIELPDLERLVSDIRQLTLDARYFCDVIAETMRPDTWPQIRAQSGQHADMLRRGQSSPTRFCGQLSDP